MSLLRLLLILPFAAAPPAGAMEEFVNAVEKVRPSVVTVVTDSGDASHHCVSSVTTGLVVSPDGLILTALHAATGEKIEIRLPDGSSHGGTVHGYDAVCGLSLIKIDADKLVPAEFGDSNALKVGQWVMSVGNQFGVEKNPTPGFSIGIVGGLNCSLPQASTHNDDLIRTDAAMNPGCVGGPLIDILGRVVGINIAICSNTGCWQGVGYAIPSAGVLPVLERLKNGEKIDRGWLGVTISPAGPVTVTSVGKGTPAERAGLQVGDLILALNGTKVDDPYELIDLIAASRPGTKVVISVRRGSSEKQVSVVLGARPITSACEAAGHACAVNSVSLDLPANVKTQFDDAGRKFQEVVQRCVEEVKDPKLLDQYKKALEQLPAFELRVLSPRQYERLEDENAELKKRIDELEKQLQNK